MKHCTCFLCVLFVAGLLVLAGCNKDDAPQPEEMMPLHAVRGSEPGIYDSNGRLMLLRGVNYNALGDYWQGVAGAPPTVAYSASDFEQMAAYGFNCVRLLFSWSKLQPQKGVVDQSYIDQIKRAVEDAAQNNLYVILDMHQDAWGKYIATPDAALCPTPAKGWDGAPQWATFTNDSSTCTVNGMRESAPAVIAAFHNFWNNTNGIQDDCKAAWAELVKQTCQYANIAGYDLLNEPNMGYGSLEQERQHLNNFYGTLIETIRQAENSEGCQKRIVFVETAVTLAGAANPIVPDPAFTTDDNLVFAPHHYFESISYDLSIELGYNILRAGSVLFNAALWVGEWGYFNGIADTAKIKRFAAMEDACFCGSAWWQWAQAPGDPHGVWWNGNSFSAAAASMHLAEVNAAGMRTGNLNTPFLNILSRTRPLAITGLPVAFTSNPTNGLMHLEANANTAGETEIWIPARFGAPVITGTNTLQITTGAVNGGYIAKIQVQPGNYSIYVDF
ncbi:hypothetical protein C7N43_35415 [Sphingobacteriales bacterium UPWRP_1]|nr:hypothetical protein BVG80_04015 [Sphingobacteriales bacterium TSM_CSM]PSJ72210.1 hypothetical protein C7N43_35415 [Sphingobacteriales bacterium UPWRP_1]